MNKKSEINRKVRLLLDKPDTLSWKERKKLADDVREAMEEAYMARRYKAYFTDWVGGCFEFQKFNSLKEAIKEAKRCLEGSEYGYLYAFVLIEDHEQERKLVAMVEKQAIKWDIVVLKGEEEINQKSLYRGGYESMMANLRNKIEKAKNKED